MLVIRQHPHSHCDSNGKGGEVVAALFIAHPALLFAQTSQFPIYGRELLSAHNLKHISVVGCVLPEFTNSMTFEIF